MKGFKKKGFLVLILSVSLFSCNNSLTRNYVDLNKGEVLIVKITILDTLTPQSQLQMMSLLHMMLKETIH